MPALGGTLGILRQGDHFFQLQSGFRDSLKLFPNLPLLPALPHSPKTLLHDGKPDEDQASPDADAENVKHGQVSLSCAGQPKWPTDGSIIVKPAKRIQSNPC